MSEQEKFLARWSRRKHAAAVAEAADAEAKEAMPKTDETSAVGAPSADRDRDTSHERPDSRPAAEPAFDIASLPPVESITADTDIRAFLRPGVPAELKRAALRKAWAADPKIRDFVGLADYDWDFVTPGAAPGFDALEMTRELQKLAEDIVTGAPEPHRRAQTAEESAPPTGREMVSNADVQPGPISAAESAQENPVISTGASHDCDDVTQTGQDSAAAQQVPKKGESSQRLARRSHGGAKPQ
jgi:hypothetical protein